MRRQRLFRRILGCLPAIGIIMAVLMGCCLLSAWAYEPSYRMTPVSKLEIKHLPAEKTIEAPIDMRFFPVSAGAAMKTLLDYASACGLTVKVPVILNYDTAKMRLYAEDTAKSPTGKPEQGGRVAISRVPERTVLSLGMSGRYNRDNFELGKRKLADWLGSHPEWRSSGAPYVVYWDGPFVPAVNKHAEVHLPVMRNVTASVENAASYAP